MGYRNTSGTKHLTESNTLKVTLLTAAPGSWDGEDKPWWASTAPPPPGLDITLLKPGAWALGEMGTWKGAMMMCQVPKLTMHTAWRMTYTWAVLQQDHGWTKTCFYFETMQKIGEGFAAFLAEVHKCLSHTYGSYSLFSWLNSTSPLIPLVSFSCLCLRPHEI